MGYSFSLSLAAVDILLEHLGAGRAPMPFDVPHIGTTFEQRAQVRDAVFRDLEGRGLASRGQVDPNVAHILHVFVQAPVAVTAVAQLDEGKPPLFARVASDGQRAVEAHQEQNLLIFTEVRPTAIVPSIVGLLPATPPAAGQSVTVPKPAKQPKAAPEEGYDPFASVARPRSSTAPAQVRMVERIFQKPKLRIGQFTAFAQRAPLSPVAWFDTPDGRYFVTSRDAEDGQSWITYAPADNNRITRHLSSQLDGYQAY